MLHSVIMTPLRPHVVLFDVMGTVVDVDGSVRRGTTAALRRSGLADAEIDRVLAESEDRLGSLMEQASAHRDRWHGHRALRIMAIRESLTSLHLPVLDHDLESEIAKITDRLDPWPDSAAAIERLRHLVVTVALSNADTAELAAMSAYAGLSWHAALSAELVQAFKPDPGVYQMALRLLHVEPEQALMVAAHPWDLRAAGELGIATAFIDRPGAEQPDPGDRFDIIANDLAHLAAMLDGWGLRPSTPVGPVVARNHEVQPTKMQNG